MNKEELYEKLRELEPTMTGGERMKAYMAGEEVDHIPFTLHSPDLAICEYLGYKTSQMSDQKVFGEIAEVIARDYAVNNQNIRLSLRSLGAALGSHLVYPDHGIDFIDKHVLKDYKDFEKLGKLDTLNNPVTRPIIDKARMVKEKFPQYTLSTGVVGPMSNAVATRPIESVLKDTRKDKDNLHRLLELSVENSLIWVRDFTKEFGKATVSISEPLSTTDILNHDQFMEFSYPYIEKLVNGLIEITGAKPSLHICGHTRGIWEEIGNLNVSSFSVDNCEDLAETVKVLGHIMPIAGNVPPVEAMRYGSIDDVINYSRECIRKGCQAEKGFILATGCQIPLGTPKENIDALVYAARKYGRGAKKGCLPKGLEDTDN